MNLVIKIQGIDINDIKDEEIDDLLNRVPVAIKEKLSSIKDEKYKKQSSCGLILLERLVKVDDSNFTFDKLLYTKEGKPYIKDNPYYISISHSDNKVCAVVSKQKIGIDIEKIKDRDFHKIIKNFEGIESDEFVDLKEFYTLWTLQESYIKIDGLYKTLPFNLLEEDSSQNLYKLKLDDELYLFSSIENDGYLMSLCINLNINDIIDGDIVFSA